MPTPKKVRKLERLRKKGLEVEYPHTPWFNDNVDALDKERADRKTRIAEAQHAELLPTYPAKRVYRSEKPRIEREPLARTWKLPM